MTLLVGNDVVNVLSAVVSAGAASVLPLGEAVFSTLLARTTVLVFREILPKATPPATARPGP